jgi:hypothetical protein
LKFNRAFEKMGLMMQPNGSLQEGKIMQRNLVKANSETGKLVAGKLVTAQGVPFLARFLGKFVLDIMPAALASVIGGFLFTQYQFGHTPPKPALEQVTPASAEMLALVRDEHAMIVDYLKSQMAAEKSRVAGEDADLARAQEDSKLADTKVGDTKTLAATPAIALSDAKPADTKAMADAASRRSAVVAAAKPIVWRAKSQVVAAAAVPMPVPAPRAPFVIAQPDPNASQDRAQPDRLASDPDSLLAKTLDLKDHVVAGARHAVSAIGDMFTAVGGALTPSASLPRQFGSN